MKAIALVLATLALTCLGACATSSHIVTGKVRAAISPEQVRIYAASPFGSEEVAILTAESAGWTSQGEKDIAVAKLKKEAASLGANGVVISGIGTESGGIVGSVNPQTGAIVASQSTYTAIRAIAVFIAEPK